MVSFGKQKCGMQIRVLGGATDLVRAVVQQAILVQLVVSRLPVASSTEHLLQETTAEACPVSLLTCSTACRTIRGHVGASMQGG